MLKRSTMDIILLYRYILYHWYYRCSLLTVRKVALYGLLWMGAVIKIYDKRKSLNSVISLLFSHLIAFHNIYYTIIRIKLVGRQT